MKKRSIHILSILLAVCLVGAGAGTLKAAEYESLEGLDSVKAVFDIRSGDPKNVAEHLLLAHRTFRDAALRAVSDTPSFAVVFMDVSVKLISKNREGFSSGEQKALDQIADLTARMARDGIKMEVCLVAADYFGVDPSSFVQGLTQVPNGWISSIGYQAQGYSLIPVY